MSSCEVLGTVPVMTLTFEATTCEAVGASVLAHFAYPSPRSTRKREQARMLILAGLLQEGLGTGVLDPDGLADDEVAALAFALRSRGGLVRIETHLRRRLEGGNLAAALLFYRMGGLARFPDDFGSPTLLNGFAWATASPSGDVRNFETRQWGKTWPVMNLAVAWCCMVERQRQDGLCPVSMLDLGRDPELLGQWIRQANILGPLIDQCWPRRARGTQQPRIEVVH